MLAAARAARDRAVFPPGDLRGRARARPLSASAGSRLCNGCQRLGWRPMTTDATDIASLGEDVPLLEGIRTTRAIRRLRPDPVPPALVRKVCEAGTFAPSGGNRQPWYFVAVTEAGAARSSPSAIARRSRP